MGDWNVLKEGDVRGVQWDDSSSGPDLSSDEVVVQTDGQVVQNANTRPVGLVLDEIPDDNPPEMADAYGDGTIVEDDGANFTVDEPVWSQGDGTIGDSQPATTSGDLIYQVGVAISSTKFIVDIDTVEVA